MANDARNTLRRMGGIMSSSPELMQVPFEPRVPAGLEVGSPERMDARVMRGILAGGGSQTQPVTIDNLLEGSGASGFSLPNFERVRPTDLPQFQLPQFEPGSPFLSLLEEFEAEEREEDVVNELIENRQRQKELQSQEFGGVLTSTAAEEQVRPTDLPQFELPQFEPGSPFFSLLEQSKAEEREEDVVNELIENRRRQDELQSQEFGGVLTSTAAEEELATLKEQEAALSREEGNAPSAEETVMSMPLTPNALNQEQVDKAAAIVENDPNLKFLSAADGTEPELNPSSDPRLTPTPDPVPTKRDLRSRYKEKIELFKEIYGEDDEDRARDKAMSLAMLGLAIASGQSPNALTNIAQGAMVGVQGMSEQEQARREREMAIQTLALETALGEAEGEAAAEEARLDREARIRAAEISSSGAGGDGYTANRSFRITLDNIMKNPEEFPVYTNNQFDVNKARALAAQIAGVQIDEAGVGTVALDQVGVGDSFEVGGETFEKTASGTYKRKDGTTVSETGLMQLLQGQ